MASEVISDAERQVAHDIAQDAMLMGWDQAIAYKRRELGVDEIVIRNMLNKAVEYNDKADPAGRIPNLEDWEKEKQDRSERGSGFEMRRSGAMQANRTFSSKFSHPAGDASPRKRPSDAKDDPS